MDETNQNESTAVAEVPLINGDFRNGLDKGAETPDIPNNLEQTEKTMNGITNPNDIVTETSIEKDPYNSEDISVMDNRSEFQQENEKCDKSDNEASQNDNTETNTTEVKSNSEEQTMNCLGTDKSIELHKLESTEHSEPNLDDVNAENRIEAINEESTNLQENHQEIGRKEDGDAEIFKSREEAETELIESEKAEDSEKLSVLEMVDINDKEGKPKTIEKEVNIDTEKKQQTENREKSPENLDGGDDKHEKTDVNETMNDKDETENQESQILVTKSKELSVADLPETESIQDEISVISEEEATAKTEKEEKQDGTKEEAVEEIPLVSLDHKTNDAETTKEMMDDICDIDESKMQLTKPEDKSSVSNECSEISKLNELKQNVKPVTEFKDKLTIKTSSSKLKSKTLDQVLSKITSRAENENQQKSVEQLSEKASADIPKKAKARKSFAPVKPSGTATPNPPITSLTFNVKELEKKGLIDLPKAQKRKAFEPMKIKLGKPDTIDDPSVHDANSVSVKSPVKSPGKLENPFLKKKRLIRRKKGKRGGYKLPGEKSSKKKNKKKDAELQENIETSLSHENKAQKQTVKRELSKSQTESTTLPKSLLYQSSFVKSPVEQSSKQKNTLNTSTKTNRPFSAQTPSNSAKKAKKSVKSVDSIRTIDSFFTGGNSANQATSKPNSPNSVVSAGSTGSRESDIRKRKASVTIPSSSSPIPAPEEKKRKMEDSLSPPPPQMITLVPTGSPPLNMSKLHPVLQSTVPGSPNPILLTPGGSTGPQTIIQNGTLNGLPMFQIVNGPKVASSQPQQLVAIGQGQSLIQSNFPRTTTLLQTNRVPLILAPVSVQPIVNSQVGIQSQVTMSSSVIPSTTLLTSVATSVHGSRLVSVSSALPGQQTSELGISPQTKMYLSNGQLVDSKLVTKNGSLPNGLYPVTPPKTPENNSNQETKDSVELSPGGTPLPDKDVIPLCTCKINGANFQKLASLVTYCQALDSVDGKVMGCCNKVTSTQVVRPAVKVPFLSLCEAHRKRLRVHQCCPGCGHFCTQGKFLQCKKEGSASLHLFHEVCLTVKDGKNYCPHCGETSARMEIHLSLEESKPSIMKESKSSRVQLKARITAKTASVTEETVEEPTMSFTIEKTKKIISTTSIPIGPDKHSLEKALSCLGQERPKKFRHLPKCLYTPAYDQDLERTLYMLEDGHDPTEKYTDLELQSALHAAATVGSLSIVHVLVQAGASPHIQDKILRTPLMYAAENNHLEVVKYLVKAGSIVDSKADDGMTALHYAAKAGHVDVCRVLLDSERIKVDVTDDGGWTALIWAVEHDQIEAVKFLLKRNADPNLRDSEENTTLHWAAFSGSVVIAELLLTAGCDLDSLNMHGDRPLHIAARQDHYECVVLFLARGADVEAKNNKGETPEECCSDKTTAVYLALKVNRQLKKFGAKHMGRPEKLLHRDLSKGRENIPIPCVNAVDDDGIPQDYLYVTDNIETTSLNVNRVIGSLQSCQCKDDCSSIYCACGKNSVRCWYDKFGRLIPEFNMVEPPLIFECNRACICWTTCNNRVVQNGVMSRLQVFKTEGRGWGCKTLVDIQRGTFICEYIGEHISDSEADRREDDSYLFDLDNRDGETYCIDARKYGNIARFINHLCEPNLVPVKVFVDSQDLRFPRICLFASRDILAGDELGFDYGEKFWIIKYKHFTCTCGSQKCRYSKDTIQKTLEEYHLRHDDEEAEVVKEGQT